MRMIIGAICLLLVTVEANAGNHGPCKIKQIQQSDSYSKFLLVTMHCPGTGLPTGCLNILSDVVTYDATTDVGKFRTSMLLSAFAAGKDVRISTWGICPAEIGNVPLVYGVTVF